jgi:hypothetical protein
MFRRAMTSRSVLGLALAGLIGVVGLRIWPFPGDSLFLAMIAWRCPTLYAGLAYTYATVWFTTPLLLINVVSSLLYIFVARADRAVRRQPLPPYHDPRTRQDLFLVLGEQHRRSDPKPAPSPEWLIIPERGLYTGLMIVGAIGSGKTSACMYPFVEQLIAYGADDPTRRMGGAAGLP